MSATVPCGCCAGITAQVTTIDNRPGLGQIAYRVGTWAEFKANMLDALSTSPQLLALKTRSDDDFTIALLDAWAIVCDVLTFYYERSANEKYLGTATQRVSIAELAKLIGYKLAPGVAAAAALAFTIETPPPALPGQAAPAQPVVVPTAVPLAVGTQVQSVPGPGELPVTFETVAPITARYAWNALLPRLTAPYAADDANAFPSHLRLSGLIGTLQTGDAVLIVVTKPGGATTLGVNRVAAVAPDTVTQTTVVTFENQSATGDPVLEAAPSQVGATLGGTLDASSLQPQIDGVLWSDQSALAAQALKLGWDLQQTEALINALEAVPPATPAVQVYKLGVRGSVFGHNAPPYATLASYTSLGAFPPNWENTTVANENPSSTTANVFLDTVYPALVSGCWIVLQDGGSQTIARVTASTALTQAAFLLASKVTQLTLDCAPGVLSSFSMRTTNVLGSTDRFDVAEEPLDPSLSGASVQLGLAQLALQIGQDVVLTGTSATQTGRTRSELRSILGLALSDGCTVVTLNRVLDDRYVRTSVTITANVAPATHGASKSEILGSGNARLAYQLFTLKQPPLTYVSAATPALTASTLTVRVNGEAWTEVPWLFGRGKNERVYVTSIDEAGNYVVQFGDGDQNGARLPTGSNNVVANYRSGIGSAGNVGARRLSTLLTRPAGLKDAINPLPASGGGDPETLDDGRRNAPFTVRALGRIVSLDDVADFARAGAAIAKANAVWSWDGARRVVALTVAGPNGALIDPSSQQYANLAAAIAAAGDGTVPVTVASYVPRTFTVAATLVADPARDPDVVTAAAKDALRAAFSFGARDVMQPVYGSEVIAVLQGVLGVVALTLDTFRYSDDPGASAPADFLIAEPPMLAAGVLTGAQLLTVEDGPLPGVMHA